MLQDPIIEREVLLLGGGHSHVSVIKSLGMNPIPGVRVTVICRDVHTPYSGMLPGFVAGHYSYDESHIDLERLCRFAGARFIADDVGALDLAAKSLGFRSGRPDLRYDLLSINLGSAPDLDSVPGAREFATPVKPIAGFLNRWRRLYADVEASNRRRKIVVVGAGAGGVELTLSLQHRFAQDLSADRQPEFTIVNRSSRPMPTHPMRAQNLFAAKLKKQGIKFRGESEVVEVTEGKIHLANSQDMITFDDLLWVTNAKGPLWLGQTGLPLDDHGFIKTQPTLRVEGQNSVFAAGDIASVAAHPREKAGVFAVRQGPPLTQNIRNVIAGAEPLPFKPQNKWLSLVSTGDKYAVATRGSLTLGHRLLWPWKDRIDRAFMDKFGKLAWSDMPTRKIEPPTEDALRCAGCGAKVPGAALSDALAQLKHRFPVALDVALADAAELPARPAGLQTVDMIPELLSDPYRFGVIAAQHALSDIWASGGAPKTAQVLLTVPAGQGAAQNNDLSAIMTGVLTVLEDAGVRLVGGHTLEGVMALGLVVDGNQGVRTLSKSGAQPGDQLVLTKPLGTGLIFAAAMRLAAKGRDLETAIQSMSRSNRLNDLSAISAMTDVTGFGLLGHAREMADASGVSLWIDPSAVPLLPGAADYAASGIRSSLVAANADYARVGGLTEVTRATLCDPQTSGGLLIALPADAAKRVEGTIVGEVRERDSQAVLLA